MCGSCDLRQTSGVGPIDLDLAAVERDDVVRPDSIGVAVHRVDQEGSVVLFDGGWCDLQYWSGRLSDEPIEKAPGYPQAPTGPALGRSATDAGTEILRWRCIKSLRRVSMPCSRDDLAVSETWYPLALKVGGRTLFLLWGSPLGSTH